MREYPEMVGGTGRDDTLLMRAFPGLLVKGGAEGVHCAALPDGHCVAVKIADGGDRARMPVLVGGLRRLGLGGRRLGTWRHRHRHRRRTGADHAGLPSEAEQLLEELGTGAVSAAASRSARWNSRPTCSDATPSRAVAAGPARPGRDLGARDPIGTPRGPECRQVGVGARRPNLYC